MNFKSKYLKEHFGIENADLLDKGMNAILDAKRQASRGKAKKAAPPPVIENQGQRLALKAQKLGVSMEVHSQLMQMLGADPLEDLYNAAIPSEPTPDAYVPKFAPTGGKIDRTIKALTTREEIRLLDQKAASVGLPEALTVAIARRLGHDTLRAIIERLGGLKLFNIKSVQPPKSPKITITREFWGVQYIKERKRP